MDVKKHLSRCALLLTALVLVCSVAERVLFARAETYGMHPASTESYSSVTPTSSGYLQSALYRNASPTSTQTLSLGEYRVASPTSTQTLSVLSVAEEEPPTSSITIVSSRRFDAPAEGGAIVSVATPTSSQVLSAMTYTTRLPINIAVGNVVVGSDALDGFIYNLEYLGNARDSDVSPELPSDCTAAVAGEDTTTFGTVYFTEAGQYYFKVTQDRTNGALNMDKGYRWNDSWYFVGITVEEGAQGLYADVTYYEMGSDGSCTPRSSGANFTQICS